MAERNPQDRAAWLAKRVGHVTASNLHKVVHRTPKGELYAAYADYQADVLLERLTGRAVDHYTTPAMERGLALEPAAALHYAMETGASLSYSDFVTHPQIQWFGASPDRLVGTDGLLEIKCPGARAHLDFIMSGALPPEYRWQVLGQMMCTGRMWCDVMYYHPDMPPHLQSRIVRVAYDAAAAAEAEARVRTFLAEVEDQLERLSPPAQETAA